MAPRRSVGPGAYSLATADEMPCLPSVRAMRPSLEALGRFDPERELDLLARNEVSVFCAPPTEYRMLVKQDLKRRHLPHVTLGRSVRFDPDDLDRFIDLLKKRAATCTTCGQALRHLRKAG